MTGTGAALRSAVQKLLLLAMCGLPLASYASEVEIKSQQMLERLESISMPIGRGAILQDRLGCLWSVMEGEKAPRLVRLSDDEGKPLCKAAEDATADNGIPPEEK
ncbi:hypothetical protein EDB98_11289 [Pseudomonas fluorescens]|nr:hypothetical protein EDB98_11289 [Pseudomonas fluorescens]